MKRIGKILLVLIVLELALGGGGRLLDVGWFSPRMILFCAALVYVALMISFPESRMPWQFVCLTLGFFSLVIFDSVLALLSDIHVQAIAEDIKPQLYFPMLMFFAMTIKSPGDVKTVSRLLKISALVLSVAYLGALFMWHSGVLTFEQVQGALNPTGDPRKEFYFRGESTFFFKAVLYVGVGLLFFLFDGRPRVKLVALFLFTALIATLTRGLVAAVFLSLAVWALFFHENRQEGLILAGTNFLLAIFAVLALNELSPTAEESMALRRADLRALSDGWDLATTLVGKGLGQFIGERGHLETNYIEILYKQGALGLLFWLLPFCYLTLQLSWVTKPLRRAEAMPYYVAALFVYFENATNPFLTNPIGMSVVLIAMVAVHVLSSPAEAMVRRSRGACSV